MDVATNGGSGGSATHALAAMPTGLLSASSAQTAMTPLGKHPKAARSISESDTGLSLAATPFE
jgi:hypothetical protein